MKDKGPKVGWFSPDRAALASFVVLIVLFYWKVLFRGEVFAALDSSRFFFPVWKWGSEVFRQGFIPLWNPDAQFGAPYLADPQTACAYPPLWLLYLLLGPVTGFSMVIVLHHLWALWGFWTFARSQSFSGKASFLGAFAFGFSMHLVGSTWTPVALMTLSWLPWVFWAAEKVFRKAIGGFLLLSLTWAMQLACGYPVLVYLTGLALGMHYVWKSNQLNRQDAKFAKNGKVKKNGPTGFFKPFLADLASWRFKGFIWIFWFLAAAMVAAAYNLVWGLPFVEMLPLTNFQDGAGRFDELGWKGLTGLLNPFYQGHPLDPNDQAVPYWVTGTFLGLPLVCLLIWGFLKKLKQGTSLWSFGVLLVLAMGLLGVGSLLRSVLPGYSLVVHSGYWIALLVFWAAWRSLAPMEKLLEWKFTAGEKWHWFEGVIALSALSLFLGRPRFPVDFFIVLALLLVVPFMKGPGPRWVSLMTAMVLSLGSVAHSIVLTRERSFFETPPKVLAGFEKPGRIFFTPPEMARAVRLQGATLSEVYEGAKQSAIPNWPLAFGREEVPFYNTLRLEHSFAWTFDAFQQSEAHSRKVLDYLGVRYVFGATKFSDLRPLKDMQLLTGSIVSENPSTLPKWFTVSKARLAGSSVKEDFALAVGAGMDYRKDCFVSDVSKTGTYVLRRAVEVEGSLPNRFMVIAKGDGKALLVSSETSFPGWKALKYGVKGRTKPIELINHAFLGVVLEDVETRVDFIFEPWTFRVGLFFSLIVGVLWTGLILKRLWE